MTRPKPEPAPTPLKSGVGAVLRAQDSSWTPGNYVVWRGAIDLEVINGDQTRHSLTLEGGSISKIIPAVANCW